MGPALQEAPSCGGAGLSAYKSGTPRGRPVQATGTQTPQRAAALVAEGLKQVQGAPCPGVRGSSPQKSLGPSSEAEVGQPQVGGTCRICVTYSLSGDKGLGPRESWGGFLSRRLVGLKVVAQKPTWG